MDTIINVQEVQAELDRAARDAQSGPAEVRAGRFVHEEAAKVMRILDKSPATSRKSKQAQVEKPR